MPTLLESESAVPGVGGRSSCLRFWKAFVMILGMNLEPEGVKAGRGGGGDEIVADAGCVCPSAVEGRPFELTREPL